MALALRRVGPGDPAPVRPPRGTARAAVHDHQRVRAVPGRVRLLRRPRRDVAGRAARRHGHGREQDRRALGRARHAQLARLRRVEVPQGRVLDRRRRDVRAGHARHRAARPDQQRLDRARLPERAAGSAEAKVLLFSNAASQTGRINGTVRVSYDDGETWPVARVFQPGGMAYSTLATLADGTVGLLYEPGGGGAASGSPSSTTTGSSRPRAARPARSRSPRRASRARRRPAAGRSATSSPTPSR